MDDQIAKEAAESEREARSAPPVPKKLLDDTLKVRVVRRQPESAKPLPPRPSAPVIPEPTIKSADMPDDNGGLIGDLPPAEEINAEPEPAKGKSNGEHRGFFAGYWRHKLWTLPLTIVAILLIAGGTVMAMPTTHYMVLAHFVTRSFLVTVTDSTTGSPVTGATVTLSGVSKVTDSTGKVSLVVPVGQGMVTVKKTYYKNASRSVLVDLSASVDKLAVHLVATGRQVPVKVVNKITGKPIPEAVITVGNANAKTDLNGAATIVLSATPDAQDAVLTVDGYNNLSAKVQTTTSVVDANTFAMVPAGRVYFLSNLSGKIDVVSTDLDGSDRKTILAGTGSEDTYNTVMLASRDWQYLALLSKRDGGNEAKLFLINTSNNKLTTIDSSAANITPVGWSGHYFVYRLDRGDLGIWQAGRTTLKSYNAESGASFTLQTTMASGTGESDYQYQDISNVIFLGGAVFYDVDWYASNNSDLSGKSDTLWSSKPEGSSSATLQTVDAEAFRFDNLTIANPQQAYFQVTNSGSTNYYRIEANGSISQSSTINQDSVTRSYPTYLLSPSSTMTFWSEPHDGKNTLFVGDAGGNGGTQIASLSDYAPYGWYGDGYLLVQKGGSELYIMPAAGGTPLKVSDYYKPQYGLYGYGGYGGL